MAQDFRNDMVFLLFLTLVIPGNIDFRPLTQFSVSMMSLLSNSYFFAETKVI